MKIKPGRESENRTGFLATAPFRLQEVVDHCCTSLQTTASLVGHAGCWHEKALNIGMRRQSDKSLPFFCGAFSGAGNDFELYGTKALVHDSSGLRSVAAGLVAMRDDIE